jgi:hypothetical protein
MLVVMIAVKFNASHMLIISMGPQPAQMHDDHSNVSDVQVVCCKSCKSCTDKTAMNQ